MTPLTNLSSFQAFKQGTVYFFKVKKKTKLKRLLNKIIHINCLFLEINFELKLMYGSRFFNKKEKIKKKCKATRLILYFIFKKEMVLNEMI